MAQNLPKKREKPLMGFSLSEIFLAICAAFSSSDILREIADHKQSPNRHFRNFIKDNDSLRLT